MENSEQDQTVTLTISVPKNIHRLLSYRKADTSKSLQDQCNEAITQYVQTFAHEYEPTNYPPDGSR